MIKKIFFINSNNKKFFKYIIIIFYYIIFIKLTKKIKLKVLICTIAKKENKYIKEFVNYYREMKFNKIIIYDNNNINDKSLEYILKEDIKKNFIKIINYRGLDRPQHKSFHECYENYNNYYDWIAFYDIDEFLYIKNYSNINQFLSLNKFKKCKSIIINWKYYGDNNKVFYENKPLFERFTSPFYLKKKQKNKYYYSAAKSLVRGNLKIVWGLLPHYINSKYNCRPNGKILKNYFSPPQFSVAYIKHYITKSTEEFIERLKRGNVRFIVDKNYIKYRIKKYYFFFNKITKKKLNLFKKAFNSIKF